MAEDAEKQDALFVNLVMIFRNAAMQQMGKLLNPLTGKVEKNLEQARFSIDILGMLKDKTRGNVSGEINKLLDTTLLELRMNYVEEHTAEGKAEAETKGEEARAGEEGKQQEAKVENEQGDMQSSARDDESKDEVSKQKSARKAKKKGAPRGQSDG